MVSPRGMLGPEAMRFSALNKAVVWFLYQKRVLQAASCVHATSEQEYDEIRAHGFTNPIAVIPNGIDLPHDLHAKKENTGSERILLSLGRIHPKKGLSRLIEAWARLEQRFPDWQLRIVGPDENAHRAELEKLIAERRLVRVTIHGPAFGTEKASEFYRSELFVLPSFNENFGLTAAEALAAGRPVVATKGTPWRGVVTNGCGWWVSSSVDGLAGALGDAMALSPERLGEMGARGRSWMARDYSWESVAREMLNVYSWLASGGVAPGTVRFS